MTLLTAITVLLIFSAALLFVLVECTQYRYSDKTKIVLIVLEIMTTWAFFFCIIFEQFAEIRFAIIILCIVFVIDALAHTHHIRNNEK